MNKNNKEKIVKFFRQILEVYDFQIMIDINENLENVFRLIDIQKGNLGGIEQEEFYTLSDIIDRLDSYHQDYVYTPLEIKKNNNEKIPKDDWDLVAKRYLENNTVANILSEINTEKYVDLIGRKEKFDIQDIIKILDEEEMCYKKICQKYVGTMSKEMLLEKDNKILHIFIEDEYINLKEKGKINNQNYKDYLDGNFEVYEYDSYQDFLNATVKDEIAYDLNDLELFDKDGNWDFYITFEELKKVGYAFMVKDHFPLLQKYILEENEIYEFFNRFSLEELEDFEKTLYLYFEIDDIDYDSNAMELYSKSNSSFNSNIIYLAEGNLSYEDFMEEIEEIPNYYELSLSKVSKYFRENKIKDLMEYGSDNDEGLYKLSSMYKELMDELSIKYSNVFTEDVSDGKYLTTIIFEDNFSMKIDTSAWNGIKVVTENVESIYETYEKLKQKEVKNDEEINYDYA